MSKLYLVDVGYCDDTVVYELVPKEVLRFKQKPFAEVISALSHLKAVHLLVDSAHPREIDHFQGAGFNIVKGRLPGLDTTNKQRKNR